MSNFYGCYNELCRNIVKLMKLSPSSFTNQITYGIYSLWQEIPQTSFMVQAFRLKLSELFYLF